MSRLKPVVKRVVVHAVARTAPLTWRWRKPGSLVVLMYHRVLPKSAPQRQTEQPGMYVSPETLDLHLSELKRRFELVHLDDWLRRAKAGSALPRLACALTFDDGWRDNYDFALPVLVKHQAPATIFLVSDYIGTAYRFWPNRLMSLLRRSFSEPGSVVFPEPLKNAVEPVLENAARRGSLLSEDADQVVQSAKGWDEQAIRGWVQTAEQSLEPSTSTRDILNREELEHMISTELVRFGSHTATHFRLGSRVDAEVLHREIITSREQLRELTGQPVDVFCYPNGETSTEAVDLVRQHYVGAVTTAQGWHTASDDPYRIRRIGVHDDSSDTSPAFRAQVSAWL